MSDLNEEVARVIAAGSLGRSPVYKRLLEYLAQQSDNNKVPREIDIATDVFEREAFDSTSDSTVRVYLHNLRQKLDTHYTNQAPEDGERLTISKGEYRLAFAKLPEPEVNIKKHRSGAKLVLPACLIAATVLSFFVGRFTTTEVPAPTENIAGTRLWKPFLDDDIPVTIVVGDYFVFSDTDGFGFGGRLIRDFAINNKDDLATFIEGDEALSKKYKDIQLTYLPTGIGAALDDVLRVLHRADKSTRVVPQSQFAAPMLRSSHIIYIGYLSGMGSLTQYAFRGSRLDLGSSFDELIDTQNGDSYQSLAGHLNDREVSYSDYGYITGFSGPSENHFLFVVGMRDEGLMRMASIMADQAEVNSIVNELNFSTNSSTAFETLYRVSSQDRAHIAAERLFVAPRNENTIWSNP